MKKGLAVVGECILLIVALLTIKIVLGSIAPDLADSAAVSFVLYALSGMGSVLIYRLNTKDR